MVLLAFEMLKVSNYLFTNGSFFKIVEHFYCPDNGKYSSKSVLFHVLNILPLKVVCSVICNYSNSQLYIIIFILKTFWKHLTDISDLRVDCIKARSQIKVKSLISCMCQYSTLLDQLSLLSLVFLYLQYIFYFVNFILMTRLTGTGD